MKRFFNVFALVMFIALIGACAGSPPQNVPTGNPGQQVEQLAAALEEARSGQLDVLAPEFYQDARSAYMKAQQALDTGAKLSDIGNYVAAGNASLEKAREISQVSRTILSQVNEARAKALKMGADKLGAPYRKVEKQYLALTTAIGNDNMSDAQKNAPKVKAAWRELEIMAIKNNAIGPARSLLAKAERERVHKLSPVAYADARQTLNEADAYIEQNPYADQAIREKTDQAEFMMRRMMAIHDSSKKFKAMAPEASALYLESLLLRMEKAMNTGDLRDSDVEAQVAALTHAYEILTQQNRKLERDNQSFQTQIAALKQQVTGLQGYSRTQEETKQKLAAEREFNERFNKVQQYFDPDEAEVYKQGGQLVIRLRGIQFPVGQATITPDNYALLSKVQKAIQTFNQPIVTIEGHTDSTGSARANMELSQKRAEAVKIYLVANNTLPDNRINAAGYGAERPLAPNTTAQGRAVNRRIDVLITPSQTP